MANILFGLFLSSMVYAAEKTFIQIIAYVVIPFPMVCADRG